MKAEKIKKHLKASKIMARKSTFSGAFASAIASFDQYSSEAVDVALRDLGQDPKADLECTYCGADAATWDHVFNLVLDGEYSGYGHQIRNLVPCCRSCNERKGKKHWRVFLDQQDPRDKGERIARMEKFLDSEAAAPITMQDIQLSAPAELDRFHAVRKEVFRLLTEADSIAAEIRRKTARKST